MTSQYFNKLEQWSNKWEMMFNPSKCEHLQITLKKQPLPSSYNLYDHTIQHVSSINYLGVTINSKLNWSDHITKVVNKANRTRAFCKGILSNVHVPSKLCVMNLTSAQF